MQQNLLCLVLGVVAGVAGGLFGLGGGILIVPVLVVLFGMSQKMAQGTSLVALLAPVGIFGLMQYYRDGNADLMKGGWIAAGFLGGAYLGSVIASSASDATMRKAFAVFIGCVAVYMFFKK